MKSRKSGLRTVDVARRAGCSVQQVRNLERDGVLLPGHADIIRETLDGSRGI